MGALDRSGALQASRGGDASGGADSISGGGGGGGVQSDAEPRSERLAPGWKAAPTADGRTYYYHVTTRKTTWKKPVAEADDDDGPLYA